MPSTVYLFIYIKLNEYFGGISFFIFFFLKSQVSDI